MLPDQPQLLACDKVNDCVAIESMLHGVFAKKRIRGEWFKLNLRDIATAKSILIENRIKEEPPNANDQS